MSLGLGVFSKLPLVAMCSIVYSIISMDVSKGSTCVLLLVLQYEYIYGQYIGANMVRFCVIGILC
jgi:hypothetical protein